MTTAMTSGQGSDSRGRDGSTIDDEVESLANERRDLAEWSRDWRGEYVLDSPEAEWVFEQMVLCVVRLRTCRERRAALTDHEARRARDCWEGDRRLLVEELSRGLRRRPALIAAKLRQTKHGSEWLAARWAELAANAAATPDRGWTEPLRARAFDLLGIPRDARDGDPGLPGESPEALAARERAALLERVETLLNEFDEIDRQAAIRGYSLHESREQVRLQREEAGHIRRYFQYRARLTRRPTPKPKPKTPAVVPPPPPPPSAPSPSTSSQPVAASRAMTTASPPLPSPERPSLLTPTVPSPRPGLNRKARRAARAARR